ncbi:P-loop NTPase fold protein [Cupriavidus sp.]|uniref:KAP family P-loop NTPase fold protein n=1 Tax=Cupriavidus sp. TaxID=1873897 RepID=UPI0028BE08F2|nr:P-loop NTPase fold protein [Cupriavidus sp.]
MADAKDPWSLDRLGRKDAAAFLENYLVGRYELRQKLQSSTGTDTAEPNTFVLNVRAPWGFGKTFFLKGLAAELKAKGHPVAFYDAWANDFSDDPIVGFIAEISQGLVSKTAALAPAEKMLDEAIAVGKKMIKPVGKILAGAVAKHLAGLTLDDLKALVEDGDVGGLHADAVDGQGLLAKVGDVALKQHLNQKEQIALFHKKMARFVSALEGQHGVRLPIFIVVDELDRCRPSYAIELLEAIKHLFGVPGIYFVVATNLTQLGHSVAAVYGEKFDAERYLKRFFDQEYALPDPPRHDFIEFLIEKCPAIASSTNIQVPHFPDYYGQLSPQHLAFRLVSEAFGLSLRDQMQVATMAEAVVLAWPEGERIHFLPLLFLISLRHTSTVSFDRLDATGQIAPSMEGVPDFRNAELALRAPRAREEFFRQGQAKLYKLTDVIQNYLIAGKMDLRALSEKSSGEGIAIVYSDLQADLPNSYNSNGPIPTPHVLKYFARVRHAGQLH